MVESIAYRLDQRKILQLCVEIHNGEKLNRTMINKAAAAITENSSIEKDHLFCGSLVLDKDHPFTFASIHNGTPMPIEVQCYPLVIQVVYLEGFESKVFLKVKVDLNFYDGVKALHTGFQVLEFIEHNEDMTKVTPFPFTDNNGAVPSSNFLNFFSLLLHLFVAIICNLFAIEFWQGRWRRGPFQASIESKCKAQGGELGSWRVYKRWNQIPNSVSYKDVRAASEVIKNALGLNNYATTVNFSPSVALSLCPNAEILGNKAKRLQHITLPPAGQAPPPPMDTIASTMLFNSVFYNNYGIACHKHAYI